MKKNPRNILKGLLLSAIATMFNSNANAEEALTVTNDLNEEDANELKSSFRRVYKNVLKISPSGKTIGVNIHRSHSSHSSHRSGSYARSHSSHTSHTSHSSSSTSYGTTTRSRSTYTPAVGSSSSSSGTRSRSSNSGTKPSNTSSSSKKRNKGTASGLYSPTTLDFRTVSLGDRTLTRNLYGNDVKMLIVLLVEKLYIRESWVSNKDNYPVYDNYVEDAVKHFQKDAGLSQTGIVDESTLESLEAWGKGETSVVLGVRDLYYLTSYPFAGPDVDELIRLLWEKGYAPDPLKLEKRDGHYMFTQDIEKLVKRYQAENGLEETGAVDETFVKKIKGAS